MMNKKIAVIGVGSGGIQSLCHLLSYLSKEWKVYSIYDPTIPIVGIGESTNPSFLEAIEYGIDFNHFIKDDMYDLDATLKLGTHYINWRPNEFTNPFIQGGLALHFNTFKLKDFAMNRFPKIWGDKFNIIEGKVNSMQNLKECVEVEVDNVKHQFDFVVDCRGFPKDFTDYVTTEGPLNHCLVHNMPPEEMNYTTHVASKDGWMFEVPLKSRKSCGYLFNDTITTTDEARRNFSELIGVPESDMEKIEFKFRPYYAKNVIDNRIIKNGNLAVFFEPMFGNSLYLYDAVNRLIMQYIQQLEGCKYDSIAWERIQNNLNEQFVYRATAVEDMIAFHYQGGSNFDTPFWRYASDYGKNKTKVSKHLQRVLEPVRAVKVNNDWQTRYTEWIFTSKSLILIDKNLGYNYFN